MRSEGAFDALEVIKSPAYNPLPFTRWHEALTYCAKVLRKKDGSNSSPAVCLEAKGFIVSGRFTEAQQLAKKHVRIDPQCTYWFVLLYVNGTL